MRDKKKGYKMFHVSTSNIDSLASMLQDECLAVRRELFWHDTLGYDYNWSYYRPGASHIEAEARVNGITDGRIRFIFVSHRELLVITGTETKHLKAPNAYGSITNDNMMDSPSNNPYGWVADTIKRMIKNNYL